jgi:iron complex outermembrane receptor protein
MRLVLPFRKRSLVSAISLAFAGAGMAAGQAAHAQAAQAAETVLPTIEVTAQGRREDPATIPYNISAVSGDDLAARHVTDQNELLREFAGASVVDRGYRNSGVASGIIIRGLSVGDNSLGDYQLSTVPTVSTYVNQTPVFANFLIKDVERVEVLRGPQGTLYGSGSLGGTVRYITHRPELKTFEGHVEAGVGKETHEDGLDKNLDVVLNAPLGDMFAIRFAGGGIRNGGVTDYRNLYVLDAAGDPVAPNGVADPTALYYDKKGADTVHIDYGRVEILARPSSRFQAIYTYQQQKDDIGGRRAETRGVDGYGVPYARHEIGSIQLEPSTRKVSLNSLELEVDLGFATLTSATSASRQDGNSYSENSGFYAQNGWFHNYYNYPRPMAQAYRSYTDNPDSEELRLISKTTGSWSYIGGLFFMKEDLTGTQMSYLRGLTAWCTATNCGGVTGGVFAANQNDFLYQRAQTYKDRSIYGEVTYAFSPALRATLGLRRFDTKLANTSTLGIPVWVYYDLFPNQTTSFDQNASGNLFKGNFAYDFGDKKLFYGTVSQGFRHGGSNAVPTIGRFTESPNYQQFKPDRDTNYELGTKGEINGTRYTVAAYQVNWRDIQLDVATPTWGFYAAQNGGSARSRGIEAELSGAITRDLRYSINYSLVNAVLTAPVYRADNGTTVIAPEGARLPGTARNTFSGSLDHTSRLGSYAWTNRLNVYIQGATENSIQTGNPRLAQTWPGFALWGLNSTLVANKLSFSVYVKNLFNNAGVTGGFLTRDMGPDPTQNYYGNGSKVFLSQPRTIGVNIAFDF